MKVAIPMVSFCDIRLSQTRSHMGYYGSYGIGLSKSWGIKNRVSPVLYTYQGSPLTASLNHCIMWAFKKYTNLNHSPYGNLEKIDLEEELVQQWERLFRVVCFLKPYEGTLQRPGQPSQDVRFYDEREWRFVPELDGDLFDYVLFEEYYSKPTVRLKADQKIQQARIPFEPSDIKYIIVLHHEEILPMIKVIEEIKGARYKGDPIKLLCSKIICADNVAEDF